MKRSWPPSSRPLTFGPRINTSPSTSAGRSTGPNPSIWTNTTCGITSTGSGNRSNSSTGGFASYRGDKGLELGEFNADGNVGGDEYRIRQTLDFYRRVLRSKPRHLKGITYYQFRDRARLGLEREDPNNPMNGIATDMLPEYKKLIQNPHFKPKENWKRNRGALRMEWRAAEDSDGLGWKVPLKKRPIFLELLLDPKANLMIEAGYKWFYKKPGVEWVDVTAAAQAWGGGKPFPIRLFAPPSEGVNPAGASKVATRLSKPPVMRLHYEWKSKSAKTKA